MLSDACYHFVVTSDGTINSVPTSSVKAGNRNLIVTVTILLRIGSCDH